MGKIIKKQFKRSLPIIVMFCVINLFAYGFLFNLNFDFLNFGNKDFIDLSRSAKADLASTTVMVQNSPPSFTSGPTENPTSTSTSPVNVGGSIGFQGTGTDGETNEYWLLICSTNSATSTVGSVPTCNGGTMFCRSDKASSTVEASCTYSNVADPGSEMQSWYAFVCDDHLSDPRCSAGAQGTGDGGSPFYVNHAPYLELVYTSDDNKDPGGVFTLYASSSDPDLLGGADDLEFYVCDTNSWTLGDGCANTTLCTGTSTTPDVTCQYTDTAPTPHGSYTYYGFIKDWHNLPASSGNGASSNYNVNDVAPEISAVVINNGSNISLNIKGATRKSVNIYSDSITDNNGCDDLVSASSTLYLSDVSNGASCTANDNNCYQVAPGTCTVYNCGANDAIATYICTTTLAFYTIPTDADSAASAVSWFARIKAKDGSSSGYGSYTTLNGIEVNSTAALDITEDTIAYGTVPSGSNTGAVNSEVTVVNYGNTPIDTDVTGEDMARVSGGSQYIGIENQKHSVSTFTYGSGGTVTSSSTASTVDVVIDRPTSEVDVNDLIYWGIGIPVGTISASYEGYNTFSVVEDLNGGWNYP